MNISYLVLGLGHAMICTLVSFVVIGLAYLVLRVTGCLGCRKRTEDGE